MKVSFVIAFACAILKRRVRTIQLHRYLALFILALLALTSPADAQTHRARFHPHAIPNYQSVNDLGIPVQAAIAAARQGKRVLVVFDIDNTLLTMPQDLGSDTWFNWQKSLDDPSTPQGKAAFQKLITDNAALLQLGQMVPTQPDTAVLIDSLQAAHIPIYALSARGSDLRGATEGALARAGIDLSSAPECGPPLCVRRGKLSDAQIRAAARRLHLKVQAQPFYPVTVSDGVMMASGQDKGFLLHLLLSSLPARYTDVYFVDDTFHNITDVQAAAPLISARIHPYSYERFWPDAADFMKDQARQIKATEDFSHVKETLCSAMQAALCITPFEGAGEEK